MRLPSACQILPLHRDAALKLRFVYGLALTAAAYVRSAAASQLASRRRQPRIEECRRLMVHDDYGVAAQFTGVLPADALLGDDISAEIFFLSMRARLLIWPMKPDTLARRASRCALIYFYYGYCRSTYMQLLLLP